MLGILQRGQNLSLDHKAHRELRLAEENRNGISEMIIPVKVSWTVKKLFCLD